MINRLLLLLPAIVACRAQPPVLTDSWGAYKARFFQKDGRVIDLSAGGITTSEGQAYAMLRAVWLDDRPAFDLAYRWAVDNLNSGVRRDRLWAWKWGRNQAGQWRALDSAFATDADQDACFALLLASRRWKDGRYRGEAQSMLNDLWDSAVRPINGLPYLLAGDSLCKGSSCRVNPSYYAPYAYRLFAQVDRSHAWLKVVDTSYALLEKASSLTATGLPPDWVYLDIGSGSLRLGEPKDSAFSYDAFRTLWRIALDDRLSHDPRARFYLQKPLRWLSQKWRQEHRLPAIISSEGNAQVQYESLEMIAVAMAALQGESPDVSAQMNRHLNLTYRNGFWSDRNLYYTQNWVWFGTALYLDYLGPLRN